MDKSITIRRRYFINKAFQINIILHFVFLVIMGCSLSGLLIYYFMRHGLEMESAAVIKNIMSMLIPTIIIAQVSVCIVSLIATFYVVMFLSHRIAGPLYRLERIAEYVGEGNLEIRVGFREKDALMPLKSAFQGMIDNLQKKMVNIKNNCKDIRNLEDDLQNAIQTSTLSEDEKNKLNEALNEILARYEKNMQGFQLPAITA